MVCYRSLFVTSPPRTTVYCFLIRVRITATEAIRTRPKRTADTEGEEVTLEEPGDRRRLTNMGELKLCACYVEHVST